MIKIIRCCKYPSLDKCLSDQFFASLSYDFDDDSNTFLIPDITTNMNQHCYAKLNDETGSWISVSLSLDEHYTGGRLCVDAPYTKGERCFKNNQDVFFENEKKDDMVGYCLTIKDEYSRSRGYTEVFVLVTLFNNKDNGSSSSSNGSSSNGSSSNIKSHSLHKLCLHTYENMMNEFWMFLDKNENEQDVGMHVMIFDARSGLDTCKRYSAFIYTIEETDIINWGRAAIRAHEFMMKQIESEWRDHHM